MQDSPAPTLSLLRHIILFALAAIMVLWPLHSLFGSSGLFAAQFSRSLPRQSALECLLVMGLAYGGLRARSRRLGMFLLLVVAELYARRHGVDISIVLLAAYALGIYCAGDNAGQWLYPQDEVDAGSLLRSAFIGVVMWSLVIWLASLAGWGSIRQIRWLAVVFLGANLLAWVVRLRSRRHDVAAVAPTSISRVQAVVYAAVMSTVLLMFAKPPSPSISILSGMAYAPIGCCSPQVIFTQTKVWSPMSTITRSCSNRCRFRSLPAEVSA